MSNIYIKEPPTNGKVLLVTSAGEIEIELWSKEAPKACRNFVQLCMEGYYNQVIFHRVIKDFIVQGGDPTGTGEGGESIYGQPFKDELHSRLRFVRRGLVAMANSGPNDNGSQFFFSMAATPELNNKHTIFGKVGGETIYNMLKLHDIDTDANDRPRFPHKVLKTEILSNPFEDIVPRTTKKKKDDAESKKTKSQSKATKNFKLLSFGEEAEEDEEEVDKANKDMKGKSKSSHDLTNDPKLSSQPAVEEEKESLKRKSLEMETEDTVSQIVAKKLKKDVDTEQKEKKPEENKKTEEKPEEEIPKPLTRTEELRKEANQLRKEIKESKKKKEEPVVENEPTEIVPVDDAIAEYKMERQKYRDMRKKQAKKGSAREEMTMSLLSEFQSKLKAAKTLGGHYSEEEEEGRGNEMEEGEIDTEESTDDTGGISWMRHKLQFDGNSRKVIDANIQELDRYEIFDPRNPMTQRRRQASKQAMKGK
ncbi:hypothetical protein ScPMuIL_006338 [Solemya velum]